jgi:hypothetical protein
VNSDGPEEVKANKEIIFTYDVNFEVVSTFDYSTCRVVSMQDTTSLVFEM